MSYSNICNNFEKASKQKIDMKHIIAVNEMKKKKNKTTSTSGNRRMEYGARDEQIQKRN